MADGSFEHNVICNNMGASLFNALRGSNCNTCNSDMKFYISDSMSSVYPDITVICGPPEFEWPRKDIVRNPTLVVEVLSPETAAYDRGGKFHKYWSLPSLREYVLVEQSEPSVDVFFLDAFGKWQIDSDLGLDQTFELRSLGLQVTMAGLSRGVEV